MQGSAGSRLGGLGRGRGEQGGGQEAARGEEGGEAEGVRSQAGGQEGANEAWGQENDRLDIAHHCNQQLNNLSLHEKRVMQLSSVMV